MEQENAGSSANSAQIVTQAELLDMFLLCLDAPVNNSSQNSVLDASTL